MPLWVMFAAHPLVCLGLSLIFTVIAMLSSGKSRWSSHARLVAAAIALVAGMAECAKDQTQSAPATAEEASRSPAATPSESPRSAPAPANSGSGKHHKKKPAPPEETALSKAADAFDTGTIAYHPPSQMVQGSTQRFELLISRTPDAGLAGKLENSQNAVVDSIRTSAVMGASLDGPKEDFSIVPLGGDVVREQAVSGPEPARWEWDVTALTPGDHDLDLTVYIKVRNPSNDTVAASNLVVRHSEIHVAVRPKTMADRVDAIESFVATNWDKLWTLILLPVGAWYLHRRRKRRRKAASSPTGNTQEKSRGENGKGNAASGP